MNEIQIKSNEIVDRIDKKMKGVHDNDTTMIHLMEEIGEISRQIYNQKMGRGALDKENLAEEIADVSMLLNKLATLNGVDVEKAVDDKIKLLKERHNLQ